MSQSEFINRLDERTAILSFIGNDDKINKIVLFKGISGVGKSALAKFILKEQKYFEEIKVKIEDGLGDQSSGYGIEKIAECINKHATETGTLRTFIDYFNNMESSILRKRNYDIITRSFSKILGNLGPAAKTSHDLVLKIGEFDPNRIFNSTKPEIINILSSYIAFTLEKYSILLNIENIHVFDISSLNLLQNIITTTSGNAFLLEYTTNAERSIPLHRLKEYFSGTNLMEIEIQKLSLQDYVKILGKEGMEEVIEKSYYLFDGNLRKLKDMDVTFEINPNIKSLLNQLNLSNFNPTLSNIKFLGKRETFLLCSIVAHKSIVAIDTLKQLFGQEEFQHEIIDIELSLKKLNNQQLIIITKNSVSITHDLITKAIRDDEYFIKYLMLSYKAFISFYNKLLSENNYLKYSKEKVLSFLFHFYYFYSPTNLFFLLPEIKMIALRCLYPDSAVEYIETLRETFSTESNLNEKITVELINYELIEIYYQVGLFEKAYSILTEISNENERKIIYKAALLDRLDRHHESIDLITTNLATYNFSNGQTLVLKLILMIDYRSLLLWDDFERICLDIENNENYTRLLEYGYFLRNTEIFLPFEESIPVLRDSITHFNKFNKITECAHSKISLSMQLARLGRLLEALDELNQAEEILIDNTLEYHVLLNNKAVIKMYMGLFDGEVEELLNTSRITAVTNFDKIIIYTNLLIFYTHQNNRSKCEELIEIVISIINQQPDKNILRFVYYNISYFYSTYNETTMTNYFINKAKSVIEIVSNYWNFRLNNLPLSDENYIFIGSFKYELGFISYWHFDISSVFKPL